jgi:hypothetical protein
VEQPARDGQVLQEVNGLVRIAEGAVKDERGRNGKRGEDPGHQARPEADDQQGSTPKNLARTGDPHVWTLVRGEAQWEGISPGRATANSPEVLMRMALAGADITIIHDPFALPRVERRELVHVLTEWSTPPTMVLHEHCCGARSARHNRAAKIWLPVHRAGTTRVHPRSGDTGITGESAKRGHIK